MKMHKCLLLHLMNFWAVEELSSFFTVAAKTLKESQLTAGNSLSCMKLLLSSPVTFSALCSIVDLYRHRKSVVGALRLPYLKPANSVG